MTSDLRLLIVMTDWPDLNVICEQRVDYQVGEIVL